MAVAYVAKNGPLSQLPKAFMELRDLLQRERLRLLGPATCVYFNGPKGVVPDEQAWEVRSVVEGTPAAADDEGTGVKVIEAALVAAAVHKGPTYEAGPTYRALGDWIAQNGYRAVGPAEEVYLNDPTDTPAADLVIEVRLPVAPVE